jgi:hypothetical protein
MSKVYVLTDGCYSDYRVRGIYDNMEDFNKANRLLKGNEVLTLELNEMPVKNSPEGFLPFEVILQKGGDVEEVNEVCYAYVEDREGNYGWEAFNSASDCLSFFMWARDKDHAIKIAGERRSILLAHNQWITLCSDWYKLENKIKFLRDN